MYKAIVRYGTKDDYINKRNKLDAIDISNLLVSKIISKEHKNNAVSNHDLAKIYDKKQRLLGKPLLKFELLEDDRVLLIDVLDKISTSKITIPSFITDVVNISADSINGFMYAVEGHIALRERYKNYGRTDLDLMNGDTVFAPFAGCRFTEVYIENSPDRTFNATGLFSMIESDKLKVVFRHPECVNISAYMFSRCSYLKELDISSLSVNNIAITSKMFEKCIKIKTISLSQFNTSKVKIANGMFTQCLRLEELDLSNWNTENLIYASELFK